jgi:hypothetical protein
MFTPVGNAVNREEATTPLKGAMTTLEKSETYLSKSARTPESLLNALYSQKRAVEYGATAVRNQEMDIANSISSSIDDYSNELAKIYFLTLGGFEGSSQILSIIYDGLLAKGPDGFVYEDLLQLAIIDFVANGHAAGPLEDTYLMFLEGTGSSSHSFDGQKNGEFFADMMQRILADMNAKAPTDSLCKTILDYLAEAPTGSSESRSKQLEAHFRANYDNPKGFVDTASDFSPMLRLSLMSAFIKQVPDCSVAQLLSGDHAAITEVIVANTPAKTPEEFLQGSFGLLDGWTHWAARDSSTGLLYQSFVWGVRDGREGVDKNYFDTLFNDWPAIPLTDEDLKEVNRIGDNVKMLQQTLKYWLTILRDEQLAIARNI